MPDGASIMARFAVTIADLRAEQMAMSVEHGLLAGSFTMEHRDPFDRMLAAQAAIEGAALVTVDPAFGDFPVTTLW